MAKQIFSDKQVNTIIRQRKLHEANLKALVEGYDTNLLSEAKIIQKYNRKLVKEAIAYERAIIVESMTSMQIDDVLDTYWSAKEAIKRLLSKLHCEACLEQFASITQFGDDAFDMLSQGVDIEDGYKKRMSRVFTDVMVIVKGLMALEHSLTSSDVGSLGDMLNSVLSQSKSRFNSSLISAFQNIDKTAGQEKKSGGFWGKIGAKFSGSGAGKGAQFRKTALTVLRSYSPGFSNLLDSEALVTSMLNSLPQTLRHNFEYFSNTITTVIDDQTLAQMTKQAGWISKALATVADTYQSGKDAIKQGTATVGREISKAAQPSLPASRVPVRR